MPGHATKALVRAWLMSVVLLTPAGAGSVANAPRLGAESVPPDEPAEIAEIERLTIARFVQLHPLDIRPVPRDAHPEMHGLVRAEFIVPNGLPASLRYGVFRKPGTYKAWIRFSAAADTIQPDTMPDGRGMAIKLLGVEGLKILAGETKEKTQDFVMINFPTFFIANVRDYLSLNVATNSGNKDSYFRQHPREFAAAQGIVDQQVNNPLQIQYWSETPYKLGPLAIKFSVRPISPRRDARPAAAGPDFLTDAMVSTLAERDVYFDFMVQVQTDPVAMPVEDALTLWDERLSPFQKVATIRIPVQRFNSPAQRQFGDNLSFTPWHSLPDLRPLGGINRARLAIYEAISKLRHEANGVTRFEPTGSEVFPVDTGSLGAPVPTPAARSAAAANPDLGDDAGALPRE